MQKKLLLLALCTVIMGVSLFAQTTGRLAGRVLDDRGNPVAFANVFLQGTEIGASTDERGRFMIINITPGYYNIIVSSVGFARYILENTRISVDETRTIDVRLVRESVDMEEYRVVAKEEMIVRGQTTSGTALSSDQITDIAVSDVEGLIALTAGVSRGVDGSLNVRGGRANEVVFTVDGMSVSDPVDGGQAMSIDMDAIAEMRVMTGGFTAEFGNAQSGMINIVTKDGTDRYEGKIEGITNHLFKQSSNSDEIKFTLGGPVPIYFFNPELRSKFTFFLNGAGAWHDSRFREYFKGSPNDDLVYLTTQYPVYDPYEDRDKIAGFEIGNRNYNDYSVNLKTTYTISPTKKLTLAVRGDRSYATPFQHSWRYALQHFREIDTRQRQIMLTYDHVFDSKRNLQFKASAYNNISKQNPRGINVDNFIIRDDNFYEPLAGRFGYYSIDANFDGVMDEGFAPASDWEYSIYGLVEGRNVPGFRAPGSIWDNFIDDESSQYSIRTDYEYQISQVIGMKTGFEVIQHDIRKNQLLGFLNMYQDRFQHFLNNNCTPVDVITHPETGVETKIYSAEDYYSAAVASSGRRDGYKANPMQFAYYLQSKMDWEGMIVNLGVRLDVWHLGSDYDILQDDGTYRKRTFKDSDRTQMMISPRLGVSHPISEKQVIHFAYNYQNQIPQMRFIFTSQDSIDAMNTPGITVGNPGLEPQITVTYEVGLQQALSEDYSLNITAYYKNIYNYVSTKKVYSAQEASVFWYEFISEDYGSARGLDLTLTRRQFNFLSGAATYSLLWAQGNNSDTVIQDEATNLREYPLDWDVRHQFSFNTTFRVARNEEFLIPFTAWILPMHDFSLSLAYSIQSGRPYTPMTEVGNTMLETNSKRMPYTTNADLAFNKNFLVGKKSFIRASFTVTNLFKKKNINSVYARTGSPYYDGADLSEPNNPGYVFEETQYIYDQFTKNPGNTNNNRNYIFGLSYNF